MILLITAIIIFSDDTIRTIAARLMDSFRYLHLNSDLPKMTQIIPFLQKPLYI